jgi:hypothetical protein
MIYRFNIVENEWYEETVLSNLIISRVYNLAAYMRRDRKIVIFNNTDNIAERNNQSTVVYDFINKEFTYEDNDIVLIFVGMNRKHSKQSLQLLMENSMQIMYAITIKSKADADKLRVKYEVR